MATNSLPEPPTNVPRIVDVQSPASGHYVVMVRMPTNLASKWPDKPWGTSIADIGLSQKDADLYPGYTLVDIEPLKGSADLYWVFQKLDGPQWTTKSKGQDSLVPAKYRRLITTTRTKQEVTPDTLPSDIVAPLTQSVVEQQDDTGKAIKVEVEEVINPNLSPLVGQRTSEWGILTSSERVVDEGDPAPYVEGVAEASVTPFGDGKAEESTLIYPPPDAVTGIINSLIDQDQDAGTGIITDIQKILITNSKVPTQAALFRQDGWYVERKGRDQLHSILICSKVDLDTLPEDEIYWDHDDISLPDTLLSLSAMWGNEVGGGSGAGPSQAAANAAASVSASIALKVKNGFSGKTKSRITRSYVAAPPSDLIQPINIQASLGTVTIFTSSKNFRCSLSINQGESQANVSRSESIGTDGKVVQIGPFLTNNVTPMSDTKQVPSLRYFATASGGLAAWAQVTANGSIAFNLPASTPASIASGALVKRYQVAQKWRLGVWVVETVEVYAP